MSASPKGYDTTSASPSRSQNNRTPPIAAAPTKLASNNKRSQSPLASQVQVKKAARTSSSLSIHDKNNAAGQHTKPPSQPAIALDSTQILARTPSPHIHSNRSTPVPQDKQQQQLKMTINENLMSDTITPNTFVVTPSKGLQISRELQSGDTNQLPNNSKAASFLARFHENAFAPTSIKNMLRGEPLNLTSVSQSNAKPNAHNNFNNNNKTTANNSASQQNPITPSSRFTEPDTVHYQGQQVVSAQQAHDDARNVYCELLIELVSIIGYKNPNLATMSSRQDQDSVELDVLRQVNQYVDNLQREVEVLTNQWRTL